MATAQCMACQVMFSVCHGGAHDVRKHFSSLNHIAAISFRSTTSKLGKYGFGESREAKTAREKNKSSSCKFNKLKHCLCSLLLNTTYLSALVIISLCL